MSPEGNIISGKASVSGALGSEVALSPPAGVLNRRIFRL